MSLLNQQVISGIELTAATIRKRILNREMRMMIALTAGDDDGKVV